MKRFFCLCLLLCCSGALMAQNSIFDELARKSPKYGTVTIHQSAAIRKLVGAVIPAADKADKADSKPDSKSDSKSDLDFIAAIAAITGNTNAAVERTINDIELAPTEKTEGHAYRVQVYSGNNHRQSMQEAQTIESQIKRAFPKLNVFRRYQAPVWKVFVGHFGTFEEAMYIKERIHKTFPAYRGMKVVHGELPRSSSNSSSSK